MKYVFNRWFIGISGVLLLLGAAWFIAQFFQSPQQREANAKPPAPQPIVVPVEKKDLRDDFTVKAKLGAETNLSYSLPSPEGERAVVTATLKRPGDTVFDGVPVVEINDRPVLVLFGSIPLYRTITAGTKGGDVQRLQLALAKLGYNIEADGVFGPRTQRALRNHFKSIGYTVPLCNVEEIDPQTKEPKQVAHPCLRLADAIFVPVDKPRVVSAPQSGQVIGGESAKLVLSGSGSGLVATIPDTEIKTLKVGDEASAFYKAQGVPITVTAINPVDANKAKEAQQEGNESGGSSFGGTSSIVSFEAKEAGAFNDLGTGEVLLTVPRSKPLIGQLVVPQRAIAKDGSGKATVLVQQPNEFVAVPVNELGCVSGQCAVASPSGQLREGMKVRVDKE